MDNSAKSFNENTWGTTGSMAKNSAIKTMEVANTLKTLQNPNTPGGHKLAKIIGTIMSWGGEAASDTVTGN